MNPNPFPPPSFTMGKHSLTIVGCWAQIVFWPCPNLLCFDFRHWLENYEDSAESTHWVNPRKRSPVLYKSRKEDVWQTLDARIQMMQSILQMKTSCICFHAHQMLELCLAHHRSTVWAILPSVAGFFPADTSSHLMGDSFKISLCSYIVRTTLSLKLLADKNMFTCTYQSTRGKKPAPWRKWIPENHLKCYKQLTTRVNRCTNKDKQALGPAPRRVSCAPTFHSSERQASFESPVGDHQGPVDAAETAQPGCPNPQGPEAAQSWQPMSPQHLAYPHSATTISFVTVMGFLKAVSWLWTCSSQPQVRILNTAVCALPTSTKKWLKHIVSGKKGPPSNVCPELCLFVFPMRPSTWQGLPIVFPS